MKRVLLPLTVLAVVGVLWESLTPAQACSCLRGDTDGFARMMLEYYPLVVVGTIADTETEYTQLDVETIYKGESVARITLDQTQEETEFQRENAAEYGFPDLLGTGPGDCSVILLGRPGQRYLLGLEKSDEISGAYRDSLCGMEAETPDTDWRTLLTSFENASGGGFGPGDLPTEGGMSGDSTFPALPAAALAVLGPMAFLAGAAFVWRRGA